MNAGACLLNEGRRSNNALQGTLTSGLRPLARAPERERLGRATNNTDHAVNWIRNN